MEKVGSKLSLVFAILSNVLLLVGLMSPVWLSMNGHYEGIWIYCYYMIHTDGERTCLILDKLAGFADNGGWLWTVRAVMIISTITSFCVVVGHVLYIVIRNRNIGLRILQVAVVLALLSAILCLIGLIVYTTRVRIGYLKRDFTIGWSFIMCAIGGGVMALILIPLLIEIKKCRVLASYDAIS